MEKLILGRDYFKDTIENSFFGYVYNINPIQGNSDARAEFAKNVHKKYEKLIEYHIDTLYLKYKHDMGFRKAINNLGAGELLGVVPYTNMDKMTKFMDTCINWEKTIKNYEELDRSNFEKINLVLDRGNFKQGVYLTFEFNKTSDMLTVPKAEINKKADYLFHQYKYDPKFNQEINKTCTHKGILSTIVDERKLALFLDINWTPKKPVEKNVEKPKPSLARVSKNTLR